MIKTKKLRLDDLILYALIWIFSLFTVGIMFSIVLYIVINALPAISLEFFISLTPMAVTTALVIVFSLLIAVPIGIFSAVYLVEYAKPGKLVSTIRFAIETLAGIPSIIYGLFGYICFFIIMHLGMSILSGSLTLSIMILPTIIRTTEEALKCVPQSYREGSLALGASKLTTITKIVLPSAMPGILTAVILSVGRVVGETAAVYLTVGMVPRIPESIMDSGRTLAVHLFIQAKEGISFENAYATATLLLLVIIVINFAANKIASKIKKAVLGVSD